MKILFCTPAPLTKSLGAAKVVVELAEEMRLLGWECDLLCPADLGVTMADFPPALRKHLRSHAGDYDVVDYDHEYLPYPRTEFDVRSLFVARSVLLVHHLETIPIPTGRSLRTRVGALVKGGARRRQRRERVRRAQATVEAADVVNVSNDDDKRELVRQGIPSDKILVIPYGISRARRPLFDRISSAPPARPVVAFVGTFDYRKGAREFPQIVQSVVDTVPDVRFRLLGVKGLFRTEAEVISFFPRHLRGNVDIIPQFTPDSLPDLLADCSVGVFPSYIEGMPFGILEMMAASLPVISYDSPGPPMLLPPESLVPRGDARALGAKLVALLQDRAALAAKRHWAQQQSQRFSWQQIAQQTSETYRALARSRPSAFAGTPMSSSTA